ALMHPTYWPEVRRGSERYIHDLASGLTAAGHAPELLTSHPGPHRRGTVDGLSVVYHRRQPDGWLRRRRFDDFWSHVPLAYRSLSRGDYELAHAFYPTDALAAAHWSRRTGRPSLFSVMGIPNPLIKIRFDSQPRAARACTDVTVDSRAVASAFFYRWGIETKVVYPGVDLKAFTPGPGRAADPVVFCPAPVNVPRKRVGWLVEALPRLLRARPGLRLLLMRPDEPAAASQLEAVEGVELFDAVQTPEELAPLYRRAWVTALPSWGEAFGMVLIESLACGTPVVAARRDAAPEIVDGDGVGRLFDDEDHAESLAAALLEALDLAAQPDTSEACRARAGVFSVDRTVAAFESLYEELLSG
ncbi:MAG: phosphatidyl-myo-inositol alpha-mannosyltransferase, partial [Thermoleophilaceae bacterium]|nr:phosphatidyl-myo-inositol alpha-mannosyltransferase [Thermoleophilaceae bacterium]